MIDVYYYGGRMAEISYDRFSDGVVAKAHPKYLGYTDVKDENYYRRSVGKGGKEQFTPIYQDCLNWLESRVEELKENIRNIYSQAENGEMIMRNSLRLWKIKKVKNTQFLIPGTMKNISSSLVECL